MITVTRHYQLGSRSGFAARDAGTLARRIAKERADREARGDLQGVRYCVESEATALELGAYQISGGEWIVADDTHREQICIL